MQILHGERERETERDLLTETKGVFHFTSSITCINPKSLYKTIKLCIYFCHNSFLDRYLDLLLFRMIPLISSPSDVRQPLTIQTAPVYWYIYIILYTIISTGNYIVCLQNMIYCILVYQEINASYYNSYNDLLRGGYIIIFNKKL